MLSPSFVPSLMQSSQKDATQDITMLQERNWAWKIFPFLVNSRQICFLFQWEILSTPLFTYKPDSEKLPGKEELGCYILGLHRGTQNMRNHGGLSVLTFGTAYVELS